LSNNFYYNLVVNKDPIKTVTDKGTQNWLFVLIITWIFPWTEIWQQ